MDQYESIRRILSRVRRRWQALRLLQASVRVALAGSAILGLALLAARLTGGAPLALVALAAIALMLLIGVAGWGFLPLRHAPGDARVARFIEEQTPGLDDRLATAVDAARRAQGSLPALAGPMLRDAARRADAVDLDTIVPPRSLRRAGIAAGAAAALLAVLFVLARGPAGQAVDAAAVSLFPARVTLEVAPGNARIRAGSPLVLRAQLVGNRAPVILRVETEQPDGWHATDMTASEAGGFQLSLPSVTSSFRYRIAAGAVRSPEYEVSAVRPPRVQRIDVEYRYPAVLGLPPRVEEDGGDVYAPAGTNVRFRIHLDRPAATAQMTMADGHSIALSVDAPTTVSAAMRLEADDSYRVALADSDGFSSPGETEYFIRLLEDRPPDVRILEPAADRSVTLLEEVDVEAAADDDFGVASLELVYALRGGEEKVVPLGPASPAPSVTGRLTLYLEDLHVKPGDFVSYYVRARDVARGRTSSQTRSDMYFLEVKPFDQEFRLAESQAQSGGGSSIDELVNSQKEVVAATWKLDRRAQVSGARSAEDIRAVARAEAELRTRVEQTASSFREQTMRDPRRRTGRGGSPEGPKAGQTLPEEDAMALASAAMTRAVDSLEALKTGAAIPPEMEALNHLLKAQADVTEREVSRQQSGSGNANNNRNLDVSSLFDRELQRQQQTNYENRSSAEQSDSERSMLDKIQDLARRQDELLKKQQDLATERERMRGEDLKRALENLTREQTALRQQAEEMSRQMSQAQANEAGRSTGSSSSDERGQSGSSIGTRQMRDVSEAMRAAAGDLRDEDPDKASGNASQALQSLRQLERQMSRHEALDDPRRVLGEAQLEARQLADAQRQLAAESRKSAAGRPDADAQRRLAGEQDRLAARARQLEERLDRQASAQATPSGDQNSRATARRAVRDLEAGQVASRMQQSADDLRAAASGGGAPDPRAQAGRQEEIARSLDRVAQGLKAAGAGDNEAQKLSAQLARTQELRERLDSLSKEMAPKGQSPGTNADKAELDRLRQQYQDKLEETRALMDELQRDGVATSGPGITSEGQGSIMSAPGSEAFKQDFADWELLRRQATTALDQAQAALSKKLQGRESKERLASGVEDKAPAEYQEQVDSYFKALAAAKKP